MVPTLYYIGKINGLDNFILVGGFNGGRKQTFVIETQVHGTNNWIERLRFNESDSKYLLKDQMLYRFYITGLIPGNYSLRVSAGNDLGWIPPDLAPTINFTVYRNGMYLLLSLLYQVWYLILKLFYSRLIYDHYWLLQ